MSNLVKFLFESSPNNERSKIFLPLHLDNFYRRSIVSSSISVTFEIDWIYLRIIFKSFYSNVKETLLN